MANNGFLNVYEYEKGIEPELLEILKEKIDYEKSIWDKYQEVDGNLKSLDSKYVKMIEEHSEKVIKPKLEKLYNTEMDYYYLNSFKEEVDGKEESYYSLNHLPIDKQCRFVARWAIPPLWYLLFRKDDIIRDINYLNLETHEQISKEDYDKLEDKTGYVQGYNFLFYKTKVKNAIENLKEYISFFEELNSIIRDNKEIVEELNKDLEEKYEEIIYEDIKEMFNNLLKFHPESYVILDYAEICMMLNLDYISNANPADEEYNHYKETYRRICDELKDKINNFKDDK